MKKILKLLLILITFLGLTNVAQARLFSKSLSSAIRKADISKSALISVSFKEITTGKKYCDFNANAQMTPASIQKIITLLPALNILGQDYEFKTQIYKNSDKDLYIKMGADPYFSNANLKYMIKELVNHKIHSAKSITIDDTILDNNEWGEGWQWDDDLNVATPKFGSYNMDGNLITLNVSPTIAGAPANFETNVFYPTAFINNVITGDKTDVKLSRKNYISPDVINVDGTISHDLAIRIPVNHPRRYFILRLEDNLRKQKLKYYGDFNRAKLPQNVTMIVEVKHPISSAINDILKRSNNMIAETVFKIAGGKFSKKTGTAKSAIAMLNTYYNKLGINTDNIKIVDGSGVSKNNLITADFMTNVLLKIAQDPNLKSFSSNLAKPGEGTLRERMLYYRNNLRAKTGTLTNISTMAGYLTAENGKTYAFCIMTNDSKSKPADKKAFEEYILREAFNTL